MNNQLKIIKTLFSIVALLMIAGVVGGSFALKDNNFFTMKRVSLTTDYLKHKSSFAYVANNKNLIASMTSIFSNNNFIVENNDGNTKSIPVLLYHGVVENPDGANVLLEDFKNQMFALKKAGWQTVTLENFYAFTKGEKELPDKSFLLTFDDGRKDSYYPVDPILKALDYNAVIFVITKYSLEDKSSNHYLSKKELQRMAKSGRWEIQAHTREGHSAYKISPDGKEGHFYSNKLWLESENRLETEEEFKNRITADFAAAKKDIEQGIGVKVASFAYPFGDFGQESENFPESEQIILDTVKSMYLMSFYQVWPGKGYSFNYSDRGFLIKRINIKPDWDPEALLTLLGAGREKPLPYFDDFEKYNGWIKTWGGLTMGDNSMSLNATDLNNGGAIFLDGARSWRDYSFSAKIDWLKGESVSLLARYKDNQNYAACNFSESEARIEQRLNNKNRTIIEVDYGIAIPKNDLELRIRVNKDKVECLIGEKVVAYAYYLSPVLSSGGIGFKTWDPKINNSKIIVKEASVE